jgi:hypothetical protein
VREFENHHPVWNLTAVLEEFHDVAIDTRPLMGLATEPLYLGSNGYAAFIFANPLFFR